MTGLEDMLRPLLAIGAVLALVIAAAWLARRIGSIRGNARQAIRIETALPLGDRRSLAIVNVEGRRLLLGLAPAQVSLLAELRQQDFPGTLDARVGDQSS